MVTNKDIQSPPKFVQPDISYERAGTLHFVEVTCPYEKSEETLKRRFEEKRLKYAWIKGRTIGKNDIKIEVHPIVIGACGTINKTTEKELRALKILSAARGATKASLLESTTIADQHGVPSRWTRVSYRKTKRGVTPKENED